MSQDSFFPYKVSLKIKGFDLSQITMILFYIKKMCKDGNCRATVFLPVKKKHMSVCRSPHVHKKSRTQFIYSRHKILYTQEINNLGILHKILFFFKTSYLPGIEYELSLSEKAFL